MTPTEVDASIRRYVVVSLLALAVLVLGFGLWATTARITGAIIAPGKVEVESNRQVVQHPAGGVVSEILVEDGEYVEAGQLLLRLDVTSARSKHKFASEHLFALRVRRERLQAEMRGKEILTFSSALRKQASRNPQVRTLVEGQRSLYDANVLSLRLQRRSIRQSKRQVEAEITGLQVQMKALEDQAELVGLGWERQSTLLSQGLTEESAVFNFQAKRASIEGSIGAVLAKIAAANERLAAMSLKILQIEADMRGQSIAVYRDLEAPYRTLLHEVRDLEAQIAAADIRAPVSGIVYQRAVHTPRAVVQAAEPLMYLIPQDRPRIIVAELAPQHIDEVRIGQDVRLRLSALNARTTPEVFGRITAVSADAIEDEVRGGYYYRVKVELNDGELDRLPEGSVLLPGMPVETFIETGARTPLAYLVKPITDYLAHAMREG